MNDGFLVKVICKNSKCSGKQHDISNIFKTGCYTSPKDYGECPVCRDKLKWLGGAEPHKAGAYWADQQKDASEVKRIKMGENNNFSLSVKAELIRDTKDGPWRLRFWGQPRAYGEDWYLRILKKIEQLNKITNEELDLLKRFSGRDDYIFYLDYFASNE